MIKNFLKRTKFWFNNARPYSAPITLLCWLVGYVYGLKSGGNWIYGILAYFGIALVHLATNLSDDYFDYKRLLKEGKFTNNEKTIKCKYLRSNEATVDELRNVIVIMLAIAGIFGLFLFIKSGFYTLWFVIMTLPIAVFYSKFSSKGLGDLAVILAYGPLMFGGLFYVMTKTLNWEIFVLSIPVAIFVETILYAHMLMDYDSDVESGKTTLCTKLNSKETSLNVLMGLYLIGYIFVTILAAKTRNFYYFLTFIPVPMIIDLYKMLKLYNQNPKTVPEIHFWHYPLENWETKLKSGSAPFFLRFLYTRNIAIIFMLMACLSLLLD